MNENITLRNDPTTEFQLLENGFKLIDGQTKGNNGFYSYEDIQSIELNKTWYTKLTKWLRYTTWLINGAPMAGKTSKKANLVINNQKKSLKIWLSDFEMTDKAEILVKLLNKKTTRN